MMKIVVGITGASGVIYGIRLLEVLQGLNVETHLIITDIAEEIIEHETKFDVDCVKGFADEIYNNNDLSAPPSSGSFLHDGMIISPCSIKTLSGIANSYNENLLIRAADVTIKEGRKLVVMPRETPLHRGHIKLMLTIAEMGAVILPPVPGFYHKPGTIGDIIDHIVGKVLDQFTIEHNLFPRWDGKEQ